MKVTQLKLKMTRTIRHRPYVVSTPEVELVADISGGTEKEQEIYVAELQDDLMFLMDKACAKEIAAYKESRNKGETKCQ